MMNLKALSTLEDDIACAIRYDARVMISGEPGTGKKFVAHLIHQRSCRRAAPFVIAGSQNFAEVIPQAQNGTLLIDGVGQFPIPLQRQLQRFLETGIENGTPRLMTTAGPDMCELVRSDTFGTDLYYRLNIIRLHMPALRDHPEDIPVLLERNLSSHATVSVPRLSPAALQRLVEYAWPGNLHELKAVAETLVAKDLTRLIEPEDLPPQMDQATALISHGP